jgi:hypothetical protein
MLNVFRKALRSLQQVGGAYCLVAADKHHDVRASLRGFQEGDNLRVLRAKEDTVLSATNRDVAMCDAPLPRYPGYAFKMTWDVPADKAMGILKVNACWYDIVFKNEWGFTETNFLY